MEDTELLSAHQRIVIRENENNGGKDEEDPELGPELMRGVAKKDLYLEERPIYCFWTLRYVGLIALCLIYFVALVTFDCPGALQTALMKEYSYSLFKFSQLMSSFSWSSIFCFLGGYFVDRVSGLNLGLFTFLTVFVIGNILYSIGMFFNIFWIMIVGRIVTGLGSETIAPITSCYIIHWFTGGKLNLAFSISNSFSQLAPAFTYQIANPLYEAIRNGSTVNDDLETRQWSLSLASTIICGLASIVGTICTFIIIGIYNIKGHGGRKKGDRNENNESFYNNIKSILNFHPRYWVLTLYITLMYTVMYDFVSLSQDYFVNNYGLSVDEADDLTSRYSLVIFFTSPLFGYLTDKSGNNLLFLITSTFGSIMSHCLLVFTSLPPSLPTVTLALSMSAYVSSYSPLIAEAVKPHQEATAYGITYSVSNIGITLGFMISGYASDNYGYNAAEYFYIVTLTGSLLLWMVMWMLRERPTKSKV